MNQVVYYNLLFLIHPSISVQFNIIFNNLSSIFNPNGNIQSIHKRINEQCWVSYRAGHVCRDQHHLPRSNDGKHDSTSGSAGVPRQIRSRPQSNELPQRRLPQSRKDEIV